MTTLPTHELATARRSFEPRRSFERACMPNPSDRKSVLVLIERVLTQIRNTGPPARPAGFKKRSCFHTKNSDRPPVQYIPSALSGESFLSAHAFVKNAKKGLEKRMPSRRNWKKWTILDSGTYLNTAAQRASRSVRPSFPSRWDHLCCADEHVSSFRQFANCQWRKNRAEVCVGGRIGHWGAGISLPLQGCLFRSISDPVLLTLLFITICSSTLIFGQSFSSAR